MIRQAALLCLISQVAAQDWIPMRARGGKLFADLKKGFSYGNSTANYYDQLIDHTNPSLGLLYI